MHTCPDCGHACTCGGDIDDCDFGDEAAENACVHPDCPMDDDWEDDDYAYYTTTPTTEPTP